MVALLPWWTSSQEIPTLSHRPEVSIFPPSTPMEAVMVPGCATILSAAMATKYPPDPARSPIETITGLPALRALTTSRQIVSEATYEPPGLSTRNRIAFTSLSATAARIAPATVSDPMVCEPLTGLYSLLPRDTPPAPYTSATVLP